MPIADFYKLKKPSEWASAPEIFSYSSLTAIKQCPLQWQLAHSKYGKDLQTYPFRPTPSSVEGKIVHAILEQLFRALSMKGLPTLGSQEFKECIQQINVRNAVKDLIDKHNKRIAAHPRGNGFRLRQTSQQLTNKIIRIFRQQYSETIVREFELPLIRTSTYKDDKTDVSDNPLFLLCKYGFLSEYELKHPSMPFVGVLDLVCQDRDQIVIVDFKTGKPDEGHLKQLLNYALLWWRASGHLPNRIEVRYPSKITSFAPTELDLKEVEGELNKEIDLSVQTLSKQPAKPSLGEHCNFCDVRQFCETYWQERKKVLFDIHENTILDLEIVISEQPGGYGFNANTLAGERVSIVFRRDVLCVHSPFVTGERLRILGALYKFENGEIELKTWSEVFRL